MTSLQLAMTSQKRSIVTSTGIKHVTTVGKYAYETQIPAQLFLMKINIVCLSLREIMMRTYFTQK